ncbi:MULTISPECIES: type VI secretion system baseplate subunit TssG [unclassified Gilliamella]|uniref:type VI secretion system baseplate subunit TssG n=1 Tax=unclassified Gilliamella TaxID=2685620 RepID=UPI00226AE4CD|nr:MULTISPECIES: type VI secretion system baseplate subunit TssG [unclassified Gilliamella]MCX8579393.1 type VI secretion system baseplate subunit TssG [Gilliamella sp. B2717]MCX8587681.1 type VI secretion system baseplate subunit TssG [Gilliamella sp. B3801]MCX8591707.1 type VI secretion system baseplate subunit TssG [Gilliamella sp. B3804]
MESEQSIENSPLMQMLEKELPRINFYRFCQLLEQMYSVDPILGKHESPAADPLRFAPSVDMSFPASELKYIEKAPYINRPTTVRTRFLGLYGVDAVLPLGLIDNIIRRDENYQVMTDFLDMFNHRVITQFYRIWLKYHYPASYIEGGRDPVSQCLFGLIGLGIKGIREQIGTPLSRFFALLGLMSQKTRTAEGIVGLIRVMVDDAKVDVSEFYPVWQSIDNPAKLGGKEPNRIGLDGGGTLGSRFKECNQSIHISITPQHEHQIAELLPDGQLFHDILALLRTYLGYRVDAKITLCIKRIFLPRSQLKSKNSRLGLTASFNKTDENNQPIQDEIKVNLGSYSGVDYRAYQTKD